MEHLSVAIADDKQKILDLLGDIISTDKDLELVGKAKNGEEMCQIIKERQPDVVLLDLIMPKMDGLSVMDLVNTDGEIKKHPAFIVITAVGQERITEDAFKKGANYYILKPFNNEMVLGRIKNTNRAVPSRIGGSFTALRGDERKRRIKDRRQDRRSAQSHLPAVRAVPSVSQVVGIGVKSRKKK